MFTEIVRLYIEVNVERVKMRPILRVLCCCGPRIRSCDGSLMRCCLLTTGNPAIICGFLAKAERSESRRLIAWLESLPASFSPIAIEGIIRRLVSKIHIQDEVSNEVKAKGSNSCYEAALNYLFKKYILYHFDLFDHYQ